MATPIAAQGVHHLKLTVTNPERSRDFYADVLGFEVVAELSPGYFLSNGSVGLGLAPSPDSGRAIANDRFDENRVGLDHLSFSLGSRADLDRAVQALDERGMEHGDVTDLGSGFGICVMMFRDPDNIQLELSSPRE